MTDRIFKNRLFKILALLLVTGTTLMAQNSPKFEKPKLTKDSILIGDQVLWSQEFDLKDVVEYQAIPYAEVLQHDTTINGGVEVVSDLEMEELSVKDAVKRLRAKMLLTSFDSGYYSLPSPIILFRLSDGTVDTLSLGRIDLYVDNIGVDTTAFVPFDLKTQAKYPFSFKSLIPWILMIVVALILIFLILWYLRYKREKAAGKYNDPPHIVALKRLEKLRADKAWQNGREKNYYSGITDTLKEYIGKRYKFGAVEMTSNEILSELKDKEIEHTLFDELGKMFSVADLVKFAKHTPTITDNENSMHTAINFVNYSYMRQLEEEKENAEQKEKEKVDFYIKEELKDQDDIKSTEEQILNYHDDKNN